MSTKHSSQGFTIVELLIVIVVITILTALIVVTYSNVKTQSYNSKVVSGVQQYYKAVKVFRSMNSRYPANSRELASENIAMNCLGTGYAGGYCGKITGVATYEDSTFNTNLNQVTGSPPRLVGDSTIAVGSEAFIGAAYGIDTVDSSKSSTGRARTIQYALQGSNQNCVIPGAWAYNMSTNPPTTACEIILEEY